ncbi:MAG: hypothetical protein ACR652_23145 [Methylocystis sp.]|uniref:hypothetical protein n=1 Tax=Methylocystis sp. TaxID=1911079 RepID=UPI003DA53D1B
MIPLDSRTEKHACASRAHDARPRGDALAEIVAMVERMAVEKRSARQIVEAVRAYAADRAAPPTPAAALVWIPAGSDEWRAWAAHWRETKGKSPPVDRRGGWFFPSKWPPVV